MLGLGLAEVVSSAREHHRWAGWDELRAMVVMSEVAWRLRDGSAMELVTQRRGCEHGRKLGAWRFGGVEVWRVGCSRLVEVWVREVILAERLIEDVCGGLWRSCSAAQELRIDAAGVRVVVESASVVIARSVELRDQVQADDIKSLADGLLPVFFKRGRLVERRGDACHSVLGYL